MRKFQRSRLRKNECSHNRNKSSSQATETLESEVDVVDWKTRFRLDCDQVLSGSRFLVDCNMGKKIGRDYSSFSTQNNMTTTTTTTTTATLTTSATPMSMTTTTTTATASDKKLEIAKTHFLYLQTRVAGS